MNIRETVPPITELEKISTRTDTRDYLAKAAPTTEKLKDWLVVDVDAHVNETAFWSEITDRIDNDVMRYMREVVPRPRRLAARPAQRQRPALPGRRRPHPAPAGAGRADPARAASPGAAHAALHGCAGPRLQVVFPTPMLTLGMHPQDEIEVALGDAYNRWLVEKILPQDTRLKALIYLPFNTPEACVEAVKKYADAPGVIGFSVTSTRNKPVHHNSYMQLYAMMEETGKPLGVPLRLQLERPVVRCSSTASSRCTRCRSCTTT